MVKRPLKQWSDQTMKNHGIILNCILRSSINKHVSTKFTSSSIKYYPKQIDHLYFICSFCLLEYKCLRSIDIGFGYPSTPCTDVINKKSTTNPRGSNQSKLAETRRDFCVLYEHIPGHPSLQALVGSTGTPSKGLLKLFDQNDASVVPKQVENFNIYIYNIWLYIYVNHPTIQYQGPRQVLPFSGTK